MDKAVFAERRFELDGGELSVRFYLPVKAPGGEFRCQYSIAWPKGEVSRSTSGKDAIQALILSMRSVHTLLIDSDAYKAGRLTLDGQSDLDLPPPWGLDSSGDILPPDGMPS